MKVHRLQRPRAARSSPRFSNNTVVLNVNATDRDLLLEENIEQCDAFCAVTNDDEVNIMSSLLAKKLGCRQVVTLINKPAYVDLVQGHEIGHRNLAPAGNDQRAFESRSPWQTSCGYTVCDVEPRKHWKRLRMAMKKARRLLVAQYGTSTCRSVRIHRRDRSRQMTC